MILKIFISILSLLLSFVNCLNINTKISNLKLKNFSKNFTKNYFPNEDLKKIDNDIFNLYSSSILNNLMVPIVSTVDTFWTGKLGSVEMLAGVGIGDQIYSSSYILLSFLPGIITPIISKYYLQKDFDKIKEVVSQSMFITSFLGILFSLILFLNPNYFINLISAKNNLSYIHAISFLKFRSIGLFFSLFNSLSYSIYKGHFDLKTPLNINLFSQFVNIILDPILMKKFGLKGIAIASSISELSASLFFYYDLNKKKLFKFNKEIFFSKNFGYLIFNGISVQLKSICSVISYLILGKKINKIDNNGINAAAHIINVNINQIGSVFINSFSSVISIILPREIIKNNKENTLNRFWFWGFNIISIISILQLFSVNLLKYFTDNENMLIIAKNTIYVSTIYQFISGITHIFEGICQGYEKFNILGFISTLTLFLNFVIINKLNSLPNIWLFAAFTNFLKTVILKIYLKDNNNE